MAVMRYAGAMPLRPLLTQHELDPLVGSERTRQRWQDHHVLAPAWPIEGFGRRLRLFPEFALAQIAMHTRRSPSLDPTVAALTKASEKLYTLESFQELQNHIRKHMAELDAIGSAAITQLLLTGVPQALKAFQDELNRALENLGEEHGLRSFVEPGRVVERELDGYVVELLDRSRVKIDQGRSAGPFSIGSYVLRDRVEIAGRVADFLLPGGPLESTAQLDWRDQALLELDDQVECVVADDGRLAYDWAFLLFEDDPRRFEREAITRILLAKVPTEWDAMLESKRRAYGELPAFQDVNEDESGFAGEQIDGFVSKGNWQRSLADIGNPFAAVDSH
jgi:hypothetical protein